jgi:hypothetical protein
MLLLFSHFSFHFAKETHSMKRLISIPAALSVLAFLLVGISSAAQIPLSLEPPDGNVEALRAYGIGVQIYVSTPRADDPTKFVWTFKAPEATLYNNGGHIIGIHYLSTGPTWEAENGSKVVGARVAAVPSPDPTSIPWLLLKGVAHDWHGMFSDVTYIQRLYTVGGTAPSDPPTAAGLTARVPYSATYVFFVADE